MIETYKELLAEIELHKNLLESAIENRSYYQRIIKCSAPKDIGSIDYSGFPKGSKNQMDFGVAVSKIAKYNSMIQVEQEILNKLERNKKAIDEAIDCMDITVKVSRLRAMGLTQEQVAELVDRSTRQVQRIEAKLNEKLKKNNKCRIRCRSIY